MRKRDERGAGRTVALVCVLACLAACSGQAIKSPAKKPDAASDRPLMSINLAGSWERDYSRDDDVNATLQRAYNLLARSISDQARLSGQGGGGLSPRQASSLLALARLAELITRPDVLTISQTEHEIQVDRKGDFSMSCSFFASGPGSIASPYGRETCYWDDDDLVSNLQLPEGLRVVHRFTMSSDEERLRVVTTLTSPTSRIPFSLRRFYRKFDRLPPEYNCVETLSMKRVCSTSELEF